MYNGWFEENLKSHKGPAFSADDHFENVERTRRFASKFDFLPP